MSETGADPLEGVPCAYAYQYHDCIRFNHGQEVNGERPTGAIAYYDRSTVERLIREARAVRPIVRVPMGRRVVSERSAILREWMMDNPRWRREIDVHGWGGY